MQTLEEARSLAEVMVSIGNLSGRKVIALLSDMNQPLGCAVGNSLELQEAIETLHGRGPAQFREHCLVVASYMLVLGEKATDLEAARRVAERALQDGQAWDRFKALVRAQGGDVAYVENPERLPRAPLVEVVKSNRSGWIHGVNARQVGETAVRMGAGRAKKGDPIDLSVGIVMKVKVGDRVETGQPLFSLHASSQDNLNQSRSDMLVAISWSEEIVQPLPLFYGVISGSQ